jgi:uncharacterized phage protein (TIGR02220 family)
MITAIDHTIRTKLGISSVHYIIADTCAQHKNLWLPTSINSLAGSLGLSTRAVSVAIDDMRTSKPSLLEVAENGSVYPTKEWYLAFFEETVKVSTKDADLAKEVVIAFNEINGSKYLLPNNMELIKTILKVSPRLTIDHFRSVIIHKKETWGNDEKMNEYNRPGTIFRSGQQFLRYLDDANMYWHTKQKTHDSTVATIRD